MFTEIWKNLCIGAALVILCLVVPGCSEKHEQAALAPQVRYMAVRGESVVLTKELPGRVSAFQVSEVRPQVGGIIQERLFEEGSDVVAGQVLYQIDPEIFQANFNNAQAQLRRAEAQLDTETLRAERYTRLAKTGAVGRQDADDAVAAHKQAVASVNAAREVLENARINLGYTKVTAPVSGRIGRSFVTPGTLVTQSQPTPLATIQQLNPVYVDVTQSNAELLKLRRALAAGQLRSAGKDSASVRLKLEDGSPYARHFVSTDHSEEPQWIEGKLMFSDVTVEQSTGVVIIRVAIENPENILLPGMYVRAVLEEGVREHAVLVPQKSVMRDTRGLPFVYVLTKEAEKNSTGSHAAEKTVELEDGQYRVAVREVVIDRDYRNNWIIDAGLREGDLLLVDGQQKVKSGQVVTGLALETRNNSQPVQAVAGR